MLRLAVLCCCLAAVALAEEEHPDDEIYGHDDKCGPLQIIRVKTQWAEAFGSMEDRLAFAQAVWRAIFAHAPEAVKLFRRVHGDDLHSPEFKAHSMRVLAGLDMTISMMDDPEAFEAQLHHLQGQHEAREIPGNYFEVFEHALLQVVHASVGRCFDPHAWHGCYDRISSGIKK